MISDGSDNSTVAMCHRKAWTNIEDEEDGSGD